MGARNPRRGQRAEGLAVHDSGQAGLTKTRSKIQATPKMRDRLAVLRWASKWGRV